ncbi:heat shock 70 kDa protein 12A isoform X2 [Halyomorpha halys]|uniref:heat shock 70 kDa protein 12A isoform X2 n=1 Tax=Halyomorpha halys TaxID=286706 RepID=UPI0006D4F92E|nr:heat shock 70 kDa protein 12A-like isoform X2 [Halyomorpha halys]
MKDFPIPLHQSKGELILAEEDGLADSDVSSISPTSSCISQTDSLIQAFNSQLCVLTPRMSPVGCSSECSVELGKETDNLVEEIYIAKHSIAKGIIYQNNIEAYAAKIPPNVPVVELQEALSKSEKEIKNNFVEKVIVNVEQDRKTNRSEDFDVVVSIDIGTTYSGYAFAYTKSPSDKQIHMMRQTEGSDRGLNNQKVPTVLLLSPEEKFHSFGYAARDFYHDLDPSDAKQWLYFDKFKMNLHNNMDVNRESQVMAQNGHSVSALTVFAHTLSYMRWQVEKELRDQGRLPKVRWVVTVPALWTQQAKQFIRESAYMADICSPETADHLLIALEPEAASVCCRNLHFDQIIQFNTNRLRSGSYMVVDCGGGTVDITVHTVSAQTGTLRELHKATGGPCGSIGVDKEFNDLLDTIFGTSFMRRFQQERPAAYNELMLSFEARKRSTTSFRSTPLNIFPPFAFIDFFRKVSGIEVEAAVKEYGRPELTWSNEGILKIHPSLMYQLFQPTLNKIIEHIEAVLSTRRLDDTISHLFLVGGFSESQILQEAIRENFSNRVHIIIPQAVSLSVLKGGVLYGLNPTIVSSRRVTHTYGLGVVKPFINGLHPLDKLVIRGGQKWCVDVLERLVESGQAVSVGQIISKKFTPASTNQREIILQVYATLSKTAQFITDNNVYKCGLLRLNLSEKNDTTALREIVVSLVFGGTEVTAFAVDSSTGCSVKTTLDFMD